MGTGHALGRGITIMDFNFADALEAALYHLEHEPVLYHSAADRDDSTL